MSSTSLAIKHSRNGGTDRVENMIRNREPFKVASVTAEIARGVYYSGRLQGSAYEQWHADTARGLDYVVYSYGTPIAWHRDPTNVKPGGAEWVLVFDRFSPTTGQHQSRIRSALSGYESSWGTHVARPAIKYEIAGR